MGTIDISMDLETIYPGLDIVSKLQNVAQAGFTGVEFWSWDDKDLPRIESVCDDLGIRITAFSGTKSYSPCDRETTPEYVDWIKRSVEAAQSVDCGSLILFPNHFTPQGCADFRDKYSHEEMIANITHTLTKIAPILEDAGVTGLFEPLANVGADAGMSVTDTSVGAGIVRAVNSPRVKLLCDVFHMQLMHGNLLNNLADNLDVVTYIHLADVPARHEPGTGEVNFDFLAQGIKDHGFAGTVAFEYFPAGDTTESFSATESIRNILTK